MNYVSLEEVYKKAVKAGYLPKKRGGFKSSEFSFLSLRVSVEELKAKLVLANAKDRALVKQVAEVRSIVRALKSTLVDLGECYWDSISESDEDNWYRQSQVLEKIDSFDRSLGSLRFDSLYFDPHIKGAK